MYTIKREYEHRTFGHVGNATLVVGDDGKLSLDGKPLGDAAAMAVLNHGMQYLQDAYAGAKSAAEAVADWSKKREKLYDGTVGIRGTGGEQPEMRFARAIVAKLVEKLFGAEAAKELAAIKEAKARKTWLDAAIDRLNDAQHERIMAAAFARLGMWKAEKAREAAELAELGLSVDVAETGDAE